MPSPPSWHPIYFLVIAVAFAPWINAKQFPDTPSMPFAPFAAGATWDSMPSRTGKLPSVAINRGEPIPMFMKDAATKCASPSGLASILASMKYSNGPLSTATMPNVTEVKAASALAKAYMLLSPALHLYKFLYMGDMSNPGAVATPVNEFLHVRTLPGMKSSLMIQDLLPSFAVLDMSKGPVTLNLPAESRMYQVSMFSLYGDWQMDVPSGVKSFTVAHGKKQGGADAVSPSKIVILSLATLVKGPYDLKAANKFQNKFTIISTSGSSIPAGPKKVWPLYKHSVVNGPGFIKAASALLAEFPTNDPLIINMLAEFKASFGFDLKNPASIPSRMSTGLNSGFVAGKACLASAVSYKAVSSSGWTRMTDISTLPPVLARGVFASSVATPNVLGLPIRDFPGATTLISKTDLKGAFLRSPSEYTFTLQNVAPGTPWSLVVVDGLTGEPLPDAPTLTSFDVKTAKTSVPVTLSYKMPKTGNWLQVPNQGAAYAVVFRYMQSVQQGRRSLLQATTATGLDATQLASIASQMASGYNVFKGCPTASCATMLDPGLVIEPIFNPLSSSALLIQQQSVCASEGTSTSYASAQDSQSATSNAVSTGVKFGKASFSASSSWSQSASSQMNTDSQSMSSISSCITESASLSVTGTTTLTPAFIFNVVSLAELLCVNDTTLFPNVTAAPASAFVICNQDNAGFTENANQLIENYGTHYFNEAKFGSINIYKTTMDQSSYAQYQSAGNSWSVAAGYSAVSASTDDSSSSSEADTATSYSSSSYFLTIPGGLELYPDTSGNGYDTTDWYNNVTAWEQAGNSPNLIGLTVQPNGLTFLLTNPSQSNYDQFWSTSGLGQGQVIAVGNQINQLLAGCSNFGGCVGSTSGCVAFSEPSNVDASWPPNCVSCFAGQANIPGDGPGCALNPISPVKIGTSVTSYKYGYQNTDTCTIIGGLSCGCGFGFGGSDCSAVDNTYLYGTCVARSLGDCGGSSSIALDGTGSCQSSSQNLLNDAPAATPIYGATVPNCGLGGADSQNDPSLVWCACTFEGSDAYYESGWGCGQDGNGPSPPGASCSCNSKNACPSPLPNN